METTAGLPTLRVDAQRNQDRIVAAAREAFAEQGSEVSIEEIARRAGVGAATVYRRFPTKEILVAAIVDAVIGEVEVKLTAALALTDAWEALLAGMRVVLEIQAANMVVVQVLAETGALPALKEVVHERIMAPLEEAFRRAQASGQLRPDLDPAEVPCLLGMVSTTAKHAHYHADIDSTESESGWERYLTLLTDALRTPAPTPLPAR
jgi:AcrR family transcriptional regulator